LVFKYERKFHPKVFRASSAATASHRSDDRHVCHHDIPQRRRDKKVKDMLSSLKAGDRVRTIGGIYGTIGTIKDDTVILLVGPDKVKLVFARGAIAQVEEAGVENEMTQEVMK
jgi:preprotein translocase YajC subunit